MNLRDSIDFMAKAFTPDGTLKADLPPVTPITHGAYPDGLPIVTGFLSRIDNTPVHFDAYSMTEHKGHTFHIGIVVNGPLHGTYALVRLPDGTVRKASWTPDI